MTVETEGSDIAEVLKPTEESKPEEALPSRSEEEIYYEYINQELVPEYGLAECTKRGQMTIDYANPDSVYDKKRRTSKASMTW